MHAEWRQQRAGVAFESSETSSLGCCCPMLPSQPQLTTAWHRTLVEVAGEVATATRASALPQEL